MGKISAKKKRDIVYITNKLEVTEEVNHQELKITVRDTSLGFIPVECFDKNKKNRYLQCQMKRGTTLEAYRKQLIRKKMFLSLVDRLIDVIKTAQKNKLNTKNLCLDERYIFLNGEHGELSIIYWPVTNNTSPCDMGRFFKELPDDMDFYKHEDNQYLVAYERYFEKLDLFSLTHFEKFMGRLAGGQDLGQGRHVPTNGTLAAQSTSAKLPNLPQGAVLLHSTKSLNGSAVFIPTTSGSMGLHSHQSSRPTGAGLQETYRESPTPVYGTVPSAPSPPPAQSAAADYTTVLGLQERGNRPRRPTLVNAQDGNEVAIDTPLFKIGKEYGSMDLILASRAVSRHHADIITHEGRYYIVDKNATNGTFVNSQKIPPEQAIEIQDRYVIQMADVVFVFHDGNSA